MSDERREWRNDEYKKDLGPGPWQNEPDKVQWVDWETGLDCLIKRHPSGGHLCGYVGVPAGHPLHQRDYSTCVKDCGEDYCSHSPDSLLDAHGGITFADGCDDPTREQWKEAQTWEPDEKLKAEALQYPQGDAVRNIERRMMERGKGYEEWERHVQARRICHVPLDGRPDDIWWFGFDCAHSGDMSPGYRLARLHGRHEVYRDVGYVSQQCESLARQLKNFA